MSYKLIINNFEADLFDDFKISFEKENQIWQFDSIKLSRSHNIILPPTPKNNAFFGFSNKPEFEGLEVRSNYSAEIWYSGGKIEGTLFVSDFSGKGYNCIFVFGNLLLLKRIKEAGKLKDILNLNNSLNWDNNTTITNPNTSPGLLQMYRYEVEGLENEAGRGTEWNFMPSTSIYQLISKSAEALNFNVNYIAHDIQLDQFVSYLGIKLNSLNSNFQTIQPDDDIKFDSNDFPIDYNDDLFVGDGLILSIPDFAQLDFGSPALPPPKKLKVLKNFVLRFSFFQIKAGNYYDKGFVVIRDGKVLTYYNLMNTQVFFNINLKKNDLLVFYTRVVRLIGGIKILTLTRYNTYPTYNITFKYLGEGGKITYPAVYQLQPNLPDLTVIDLLKIVANLSNTAIYLDGDTVKFFNYYFSDADLVKLYDVISENRLTRSILDYAQDNIVDFASSDNVRILSKLQNIVKIENQNLEKEKTVSTIPLSEGNKGSYNNYEDDYNLKISDIKVKVDENGVKSYEFGTDKDTIFTIANNSNAQIKQAFFRQSEIQNVFFNSTSVEITISQRLFQFMDFNEFTTFLYKNKKWSWTKAMWSDNVAKLELIKLPDNIKLVGYVAFSSSNLITIKSGNFSNAKTKLKFSYNNKEIFPNYNDDLDGILTPKNLILGSGVEITNNKNVIKYYTPSEWLVQDEVYTALYDIKLKDNATRILPILSRGNSSQLFGITSPIVGIRTTQIATGEAKYADGRTPQDDPRNGILDLYILPNEQSTGGANNTIYKIKVEKGDNPNPIWTPAPIDSVSIFDKSANVTASIVGDELVITAMSGNDGWVDMKFEYLNFEEIKRITIVKE